jgi:hypothetical protein
MIRTKMCLDYFLVYSVEYYFYSVFENCQDCVPVVYEQFQINEEREDDVKLFREYETIKFKI